MNGSLTEEAATPRLLASVHLSASPSSGGGGGTPGRTSQIAEEPEPGAAGGARRRGSPARGHEPPAPGPGVGAHARGQDGGVGGGGEEGRERRRAGSPAESRLRAGGLRVVRCALQVSALLGSRRPWWVGPGCSEEVRAGHGAWVARGDQGPPVL